MNLSLWNKFFLSHPMSTMHDAGGRARSGAWAKYGMELIGLIARHPRLWRLQASLQSGWPVHKMINSTSCAAFAGKPAGGKR